MYALRGFIPSRSPSLFVARHPHPPFIIPFVSRGRMKDLTVLYSYYIIHYCTYNTLHVLYIRTYITLTVGLDWHNTRRV